MKKLVFRSLILGTLLIGTISCQKESISEASTNTSVALSEIQTRAVQGEGDCYMRLIIYQGYLECRGEGHDCKVPCSVLSAGDAELIAFLSSLDPATDNTISIQTYLSGLSYIPNAIQQEIQSANVLHLSINQNNENIIYAIHKANGQVLYAFSFDA